MSPDTSERAYEEAIDCGLLAFGLDTCAGDVPAVRETSPPPRRGHQRHLEAAGAEVDRDHVAQGWSRHGSGAHARPNSALSQRRGRAEPWGDCRSRRCAWDAGVARRGTVHSAARVAVALAVSSSRPD
jgi:hypothetical protein